MPPLWNISFISSGQARRKTVGMHAFNSTNMIPQFHGYMHPWLLCNVAIPWLIPCTELDFLLTFLIDGYNNIYPSMPLWNNSFISSGQERQNTVGMHDFPCPLWYPQFHGYMHPWLLCNGEISWLIPCMELDFLLTFLIDGDNNIYPSINVCYVVRKYSLAPFPSGKGLLSPCDQMLGKEPKNFFLHFNKPLLLAIRDCRHLL